MRIVGVILLVIGILMFIFGGFNFETEKKVVDLGPLEVNKTEKRHIGWPAYAGAIVVIGGLALIIIGNRNKK